MQSQDNNFKEMHVCPYWSASAKSCLASKQGLYLPVPEHIHTYCRTSNHPFCPQFELQATDPVEGEHSLGKIVDRRERKVADRRDRRSADRRGHVRIAGSFPLQLTELQEGTDAVSFRDNKATTVDLSATGIRLQAHCELPVNSMISFSLNGSSGPPVQGIGQIKWCRSLEEGSLYQAGIVFTDTSISGAMRRYIGACLS